MKYGTALRVARLALTVAIIVILVFPLVSSIASTNVKEMNSGIESTYDLYFDDGKLDNDTYKAVMKTNLSQIGDISGDLPFDGIAINGGNPTTVSTIDGALDLLLANRSKNATATIYSEGKVCIQNTIQYHTGFETIVKTGMKVPDNIGGLASFDINLSFVGRDVEYSIPYGSGEIVNNYLIITTTIPDLLNMLCNSTNQDMEFKVHVSVLALANFDVDVDIFTKNTVEAKYNGTNTITFSNTAIGTIKEVSVGENGNVKYKTQTDGTVNLWVSTGSIWQQLEAGKSTDGTLKIVTDGTVQKLIAADQADVIIKIVKYLEERE